MAVDFRALLSVSMDEIKRPPAWPAGTYEGVVKAHEFGQSRNKKTPFVRYHFTVTGVVEVEDPAILEGIDLSKKDLTKDFYLTEDARFMVKDFLVSLGVETTGRHLSECIPEATNAKVVIAITQRNSEDGKNIFNDVGEVRGAE